VNNLFLGISLISVTALANGVFSIPLRHRRRYAVENMWIVGFVLGNFALPQLAVQFLVPGWWEAIRSAPVGSVLLALALGAGWGVASVFFSQAIARVGVSLGYALIMGLIMVTGSVIPLARNCPPSAMVWTLSLAGIAVALAGVALAGRAGILRERSQNAATNANEPSAQRRSSKIFVLGVIFCVIAGLLSACSNLGYDLFKSAMAGRVDPGVHPAMASMVPWLPLYWSGPATVLIISAVQMTRNRTWNRFRGEGAAHDLRLTLLMAVLFSLTQIPYGMGAAYMGKLGTSVGFAISMVLSLAVANLAGVLTGEWRGAGRKAFGALLTGLACLVAATLLLAWASQA
jgi:L-rhamnose-H+ transport protein